MIENLEKTEKEISEKHGKLMAIDYDKIRSVFKLISDKYEKLIRSNLQGARSFEALKSKLPEIANDVKAIAEKAVRSKESWISKTISSGVDSLPNSKINCLLDLTILLIVSIIWTGIRIVLA